MKQVIVNCSIEWDVERGVLYVHNNNNGSTAIRICGLKRENMGDLTAFGNMIDITRPAHVTYPTK